MGFSQLITARHEGVKKTLTVAEWSQLLGVPRKTLYARLQKGKVENDFLKGIDSKNKTISQQENTDDFLNQYYSDFNYSHGIINMWRQKNGIR